MDEQKYGIAAAIVAAAAAAAYYYRDRIRSAFRMTQWEIVSRSATEIGKGMRPEWLSAVMAFETGCTFDPAIVNKVSKATGLIQFMPSTARAMGTTTEDLSKLDFTGQMVWVVKYFRRSPVKLFKNLGDVYMVVLWPSAAGKPDDYVLFSDPSIQYKQNAGLDRDKKGYVTRADALRQVRVAATRCPIEGQPAISVGGVAERDRAIAHELRLRAIAELRRLAETWSAV